MKYSFNFIIKLIILILLISSCNKNEEIIDMSKQLEYPQIFYLCDSKIKNFTVLTGSNSGMKNVTNQFTPKHFFGNRIYNSPSTLSLLNDSVISFENFGMHIYKRDNDSIYIQNFNKTWSNIGYYKNKEIVYHIALIYIYIKNDRSQTSVTENSYYYFNQANLFKIYPTISETDLNEECDKIAWCNIFSRYNIQL